MSEASKLGQIKALCFDVFGTVVDWRTTVINELQLFGSEQAINADWSEFADRWRTEGYMGGMRIVQQGSLPFQTADALHHRMLTILLEEIEFDTKKNIAAVKHLNTVWHRLQPWPDSVLGLERLRSHFIVSTLSNGNISLLTNMAKYSNLRWDVILSAEITGAFKPNPECYRNAANLLGFDANEIMLVAAHESDLLAAQAVGFGTAYVFRPTEYGIDNKKAIRPDLPFDFIANDFSHLAELLAVPKVD
ncbi:MAG TPA: haloacid dehalogenase type II [Dehalococcoidia bacterium]|nr:haloacid dehalogenase type II [Dehalococcoidia bacterium]